MVRFSLRQFALAREQTWIVRWGPKSEKTQETAPMVPVKNAGVLQAWTYTTRRRASCNGFPWPFPLLWCPQNSKGRVLREGKCVLQPLRAGGGAQPRGYFLTLKSKAQSCLQSFKSIWPNNPTYGYLFKENENRILKGYLYYHVYCTNIYNSQIQTHPSMDEWINKMWEYIYV